MYDIGYIEKYGSGIYLENELCLKNGNPKPVYEIDSVQTKVIFKSQVKDVTVVEIEEKNLEGLNERQKKAIEYIKENNSITKGKYMEINKISHKTAYEELNGMVNKKGINPNNFQSIKELKGVIKTFKEGEELITRPSSEELQSLADK